MTEAPQHPRGILCLPPGDKSWLIHTLQILPGKLPLLHSNNPFTYLHYNSRHKFTCAANCLASSRGASEGNWFVKEEPSGRRNWILATLLWENENLTQHLYLYTFSNDIIKTKRKWKWKCVMKTGFYGELGREDWRKVVKRYKIPI